MNFLAFVKSIIKEQTPASDIAESIEHDANFPKNKSEEEMISYIKHKTSSNPTIYAATEELIRRFKDQL